VNLSYADNLGYFSNMFEFFSCKKSFEILILKRIILQQWFGLRIDLNHEWFFLNKIRSPKHS